MNFNTLSPTARVLKKLQNYTLGMPVSSRDNPSIAVINACDIDEGKNLVQNVVAGIRMDADMSVFVHNVPYFGYADKVNPMTAKFTESFRRTSATNAKAIIKTCMADGVVIVTGCEVTAAGLLEGCLEINCPAVVLPLGVEDASTVLQLEGTVTSGKITSAAIDEILQNQHLPRVQSSFFILLEKLGFCVPSASTNKRGGRQAMCALEAGKSAVNITRDIRTPKKILTKQAWQDVVDFCLTGNHDISGLYLLSVIFSATDNKISLDQVGERIQKTSPSNIARLTGTAVGGYAFCQFNGDKPAAFSGKAWVYQNLEDADRAIHGGNVPNKSVVVLQNCLGMDISCIANAIIGMGRAGDIAIATDGICESTEVLTVTYALPHSYENEEFANIQNGDLLEIDVVKGRFNTNILSKELKTRAKRNTTKKPGMYF